MKPALNFLLPPLILLLLLCMLLHSTDARKNGEKKSKSGACRYDRRGDEGPCNGTSNTKVVTLQLRKGNPAICQAVKVISRSCQENRSSKKRNGCKYDRRGSVWSKCDVATKQMSKVMKQKEGSSIHCPLTKTKTKSCGAKKANGPRRTKKGCVYKKQPWSECNMDTKTRQREMVLAKGEPSVCLPKKIVTKICKKEFAKCRFTKGEWGPCNPATHLVQRTLTPKVGQPTQCVPAAETRPCQQRAVELVGAKANKCRYNVSDWSACDLRSNTMTQWLTLKSGDPGVCQRSKKLTKKCRIACKFRRGDWSDCNKITHLTTRVDLLVKGSHHECDLTREITKKCKRVCKYNIGDWGPCDPVTNHRTRVKKLIEGGNPSKCRPEEIITKPCTKKDGKERCFLGSWGDFGPCTNGVMTKHRPVFQGGVKCERRGVITKACDKTS